MSGFQIESDVPPPPGPKYGDPRLKYPWPFMDIGDSFKVECPPEEVDRRRSAAYQAGKDWIMRNNRPGRLMSRRVQGGFRIWLVEGSYD